MTYFEHTAKGTALFRAQRGADLPVITLTEGITAAPILGERLNINVVVLSPDAVAPRHTHDEEQMGYIVRGTAEFDDGERTWLLEAGDVYHAPPGAQHGARAIGGEVVIIDVFSPPRAGIREMLEGR
jgi:quercetin dioxygenase-like cupin family protein